MIGSTRRVSVWAFGEPVDMRKSYNGLSALVREGFARDVLSGDIFVFVGKSRRRAKALYWDGTGLCLFAKRLEKGRFAALWNDQATHTLTLTMSELTLFFEGSELIGKKSLSPPEFNLDTDGAVMLNSFRREHRARK